MAWWRKPSAQTPTWSLEDYHAAFVATVTAQIARGVAPWQQSWTPGARRLPEHLVSGHAGKPRLVENLGGVYGPYTGRNNEGRTGCARLLHGGSFY